MLDIFISIVCEEAVSISDRAAPRDWMSELNWKGDRSKRLWPNLRNCACPLFFFFACTAVRVVSVSCSGK
jgi:hypothetical protein